mmetsp:Transcript_124703/g.285704  ORF Transcript_124703/g.285704 Transcript_124703/m.285704 type:complete len:90 (+) Transcript_124703:158-427(+)
MGGSFTPVVCTVDGVFHREFVAFMKRVAAAALAGYILLRRKSYEEVMCWVRIRLHFALIPAVDLRLRGSRVRFHSSRLVLVLEQLCRVC